MAGPEAPSGHEIVDFLRGLRTYRAPLAGPDQVLLDSLVSAGLGRTLYEELKGSVARYWRAYGTNSCSGTDSLSGSHGADTPSWDTTPWGLAFGARGRYPLPRGNGPDRR
jgi:hypothetical protein